MTILKVIVAILLPPVAAAMEVGISKHFWINLLLTILGYLPGLIHALWLVLSGRGTAAYQSQSPGSRP